uniref:Uncharacterized protein n=1 Tax=Lygus hesperus TaxID=30085 RepID=A0A0A9WCK6_LYGHE
MKLVPRYCLFDLDTYAGMDYLPMALTFQPTFRYFGGRWRSASPTPPVHRQIRHSLFGITTAPHELQHTVASYIGTAGTINAAATTTNGGNHTANGGNTTTNVVLLPSSIDKNRL